MSVSYEWNPYTHTRARTHTHICIYECFFLSIYIYVWIFELVYSSLDNNKYNMVYQMYLLIDNVDYFEKIYKYANNYFSNSKFL